MQYTILLKNRSFIIDIKTIISWVFFLNQHIRSIEGTKYQSTRAQIGTSVQHTIQSVVLSPASASTNVAVSSSPTALLPGVSLVKLVDLPVAVCRKWAVWYTFILSFFFFFGGGGGAYILDYFDLSFRYFIFQHITDEVTILQNVRMA